LLQEADRKRVSGIVETACQLLLALFSEEVSRKGASLITGITKFFQHLYRQLGDAGVWIIADRLLAPTRSLSDDSQPSTDPQSMSILSFLMRMDSQIAAPLREALHNIYIQLLSDDAFRVAFSQQLISKDAYRLLGGYERYSSRRQLCTSKPLRVSCERKEEISPYWI
jgi:hypothetical protein